MRALSSNARARPRLQSDFINGLLRCEMNGRNKYCGASRPKRGIQSLDIGRNEGDADGPGRQGKFVWLDEQGRRKIQPGTTTGALNQPTAEIDRQPSAPKPESGISGFDTVRVEPVDHPELRRRQSKRSGKSIMLNCANPQDVRAGLQIDVAGRQVDDEIVSVRVFAYEPKFEVKGLFSVEERLFERIRYAPGAGRERRQRQGDEDGGGERQ